MSVFYTVSVSRVAAQTGRRLCGCNVRWRGHSVSIAERLTTGRLYGLDQDGDALAASRERLAPYLDRVILIKTNFRDMALHTRNR